MRTYLLYKETAAGDQTEEFLEFGDDSEAILYALPLAAGGLLELRRGATLIATVDERPCLRATERKFSACAGAQAY